MKWYYVLGLCLVFALVVGFLVFFWFEPKPEALKLLDKDGVDKDKQDELLNTRWVERDPDQDTNLDNKNYDRSEVLEKQREWQERKPTMGSSSYTNEPTDCAKKHDRSLC